MTTSSVATGGSTSAASGAATGAGAAPRSVIDEYGGLPVGAHPDLLVALELLALGLQRGSHHELRPVELGDVLVTAGRHRGPQRAHEVERSVVLACRPDEDLLHGPVLGGAHPGAARERRVK